MNNAAFAKQVYEGYLGHFSGFKDRVVAKESAKRISCIHIQRRIDILRAALKLSARQYKNNTPIIEKINDLEKVKIEITKL